MKQQCGSLDAGAIPAISTKSTLYRVLLMGMISFDRHLDLKWTTRQATDVIRANKSKRQR